MAIDTNRPLADQVPTIRRLVESSPGNRGCGLAPVRRRVDGWNRRRHRGTAAPRERPILRGLSAEVQLEQLFEDRVVTGVQRPAVGGKDGPVEIVVGVCEPGRALVVEISERPLTEFRRVETGRVEPAVAEADELAGCPGDRLALLVDGAREREGLERGRRCVSRTGFQLGPGRERPELVNARVKNAEGVVIVASDGDELMVGETGSVSGCCGRGHGACAGRR